MIPNGRKLKKAEIRGMGVGDKKVNKERPKAGIPSSGENAGAPLTDGKIKKR
jgi:hypothetical protein